MLYDFSVYMAVDLGGDDWDRFKISQKDFIVEPQKEFIFQPIFDLTIPRFELITKGIENILTHITFIDLQNLIRTTLQRVHDLRNFEFNLAIQTGNFFENFIIHLISPFTRWVQYVRSEERNLGQRLD